VNWLERAACEISEMAGKPPAKTPVSSVLAVPHAGVSQKSEDMDADRTPPEGGKPPSARSLTARPCATCVHFRATPDKDPGRALHALPGRDLGRVPARLRRWLDATVPHTSSIAPGQGH